MLEWLQKILLKFEMWQFFFLKESHRKLAKRVQSKEPDMRIVVTAHLKGTRVKSRLSRVERKLLD
jgi:hypothetical protein